MITGPAQRKIVLMPSSTRRPSLPNSGPRWSIVGMSMARRMRSGTGVGPGICRKCRPAVRDEFFAMDLSSKLPLLCLSSPGTNAISNQAYSSVEGRRMAAQAMPGLERRLKAEVKGDVLFDRFSRGRYATDASHYQMMPVGVVVPRTVDDAVRAIALARAEGVTVLPRGGGTSQYGQTANNSCGGRSLRYGTMRDNVLSIDAVLADGTAAHFGPVAPDLRDLSGDSPLPPLAADLLALGRREADEVEARFPKVQRRVGGYNLDALVA